MTDAQPAHAAFPIVGVGASAGGLEAITEFIAELPAGSAVAVLVVQHLDPTRPSLLADILAKRTPMQVTQAEEGMAIAAGYVYVIPPNTSMSVVQGTLRLKPRNSTMGTPMPVDDLLESLAKDQGANAIGIVMSGSGTDGAIGMQAIKGYGGITFAQDETTARFASMPRAAVSLGCVDFVLAPRGIAREVLRVAAHPHLVADEGGGLAGNAVDAGSADLRPLFRKLFASFQIDFSHYKRGTIVRRLSRRMALHGIDQVPHYVAMIDADSAEARALCRDLLIRYTEFFRDPDAFTALADTVLPRLLQAPRGNDPLRIWVPGCASGEEVYSIAICVAEYLARHALATSLQVFGTDLSDEALTTARAGRYIENIARNVSAERLARFFVQDGDRYQVVKSIRDCCTFARQNVAYDPPFSRIDLVSCRNLLIYLDPSLQKRVMPSFHFALKRDGVLMLGLSESIGAGSELFSVIESRRAKLYAKRLLPGRAAFAVAAPAKPGDAGESRPSPTDKLPELAAAEVLRHEADQVALARYAPAFVLCDDEFNVLEFHGDTAPFLSNPPGAPTNQLQRLARPGLFIAISDALRQVRSAGAPVRKGGLQVDTGGGDKRAVAIEVHPVQPPKMERRWFLVFFALAATAADGPPAAAHGGAGRPTLLSRLFSRDAPAGHDALNAQLERLTEELRATRQQARVMLDEHETAMEELKSLEEETQASNEEFQSTNEELETAKEELQSVNEELSTTNDELRSRHRELKSVHREVTVAREYADALLETMSSPLLVLDAGFLVVRANQAYYDAFLTRPADTLQRSLYALGNGEWDVPPLRVLLEDMLPNRPRVRDYEITATFPRIGARSMRLHAARVEWTDHALMLLMIEDVTERRDAMGRLTTADRQKDEFLAMLAHELRNPLAAMSGALNLWMHDGSDALTQLKARETLRRQLQIQTRLVDDLLDVSRITRGLVTLRRERFDFAQTVRETQDALLSAIAARGHDVRLLLPMGGLTINADRARLAQVVVNLLGNALKYTPPGGFVSVELLRDGDDAVLSVSDNGMGMSSEFLGEIFGVFVQADRSIERSVGGLGIGLAVVRRLVELHGGGVTAHSAGLGRGSRFVVRLPIGIGSMADDAASAFAPPPVAAAAPEPTPQRILVVDDNADAAEATAALLRLDGHEVRVAGDGPAALREIDGFVPQAVLLDIGLPGMSGYEVCRRLRQLPVMGNALVIAISGYGTADALRESREAGFDHHVTKPADPVLLAQRLQAHVTALR